MEDQNTVELQKTYIMPFYCKNSSMYVNWKQEKHLGNN